MEFKSYIMDSAAVGRALARISHEIVERNPDEKELFLVGIMRKGAPIADVLAAKIREIGTATKVGYLDTTLYRDDIGSADDVSFTDGSKIDFSVTDKTVIMVDDGAIIIVDAYASETHLQLVCDTTIRDTVNNECIIRFLTGNRQIICFVCP